MQMDGHSLMRRKQGLQAELWRAQKFGSRAEALELPG
jgi:hypothetical protein